MAKENNVMPTSNHREYLRSLWYDCLPSMDGTQLHDFFHERNHSDRYALVIYMSRRCSALHRVYCEAFEDQPVGMAYADTALPGLYDYISDQDWTEKRILVVDDILIHGRALQGVWEYLVENYKIPGDSIDIDVYGYCVDCSKCLKPEVKKRVLANRKLGKAAWRTLSDQLIKLVSRSGVPHAAFVFSWLNDTLELDSYQDILNDNTCYFDLTDSYLYGRQITKGILTSQKESYPSPIVNELVSRATLRIIYNKADNWLTLIPFVFTRPICRNQLHDILKKVADCLPPEFKAIKETLVSIQERQTKGGRKLYEEYQLRLLNCLLSIYVGVILRKQYIHEENTKQFVPQIDVLKFSFPTELAELLIDYSQWINDTPNAFVGNPNRVSQDITRLTAALPAFQGDNAETAADMSVVKEKLLYVLSDVYISKDETKWTWYKYFAKIGEIDDWRADVSKERLSGLPNTFIQTSLQERFPLSQQEELYAYLVDSWDCGSSALKYRIKEDICEMYCSAGELSPQYYLRRFSSYILKFQEICKNVALGNDVATTSFAEVQKAQMEAMYSYVENEKNADLTASAREDLRNFIKVYGTEIFTWKIDPT